MKKIIFFLVAITLSLVYSQLLSAQTIDKGREAAKGSMNFMATAAWLKLHPEPPLTPTIDNDEDNDTHPPRTTPVPPTKIFKQAPTPPVPLISLPVSPAPSDTFESTLSPGGVIPPDTHGAVDSTYCMTTINSTVKIQTRSGGAVSSVSLNAFWTSLVGGGCYDPRIHYDPYTNRWIFITDAAAESASSALLIAISKTGDPTGSWWTYKIVCDKTGVDWLDFPEVGFNKKWITVTGNMFSVASNSYDYAKVFAFDKDSLLAGVSAPFTSFTQPTSFTLCPAQTYDTAEINQFMVESWDGSNSGGGLMQLWKISGAVGSEAMNSVGFPISTGFNWQQSSFAATGPTPGADFAPQSGTSNLIQTNDDRVDQLTLMNHNLWFAHTVFLPYSSSVNPTRSSVQWWETDTTGTPLQIGTVDDPTNTNFYAFPALAVNMNNDALIGFGAMSGSTHPSAAYAMHMHTDPVDSLRPQQVFRHGQTTYYITFSGTKNRWGDYSGAVVDPANMTDFWTIQEASANPASTWDTWWANVKLCSPPASVTGTTIVCAGLTTPLGDDTTGGNWTSSNTAIATVGSGSGIVTGVSGGTATITYTINGGCTATTNVTVNPAPGTITGPTSVCTTLTTTLSDAGTGTWTSSNTFVATIGSGSGTVTGVSAGTSVITYTLSTTGCISTTTVTVNTLPAAITGATTVCSGATTALTDAGGGTWMSSNTSYATVGLSSGLVNGVTAGTATITYSLGAGCTATASVVVNQTPVAITGTTSVCAGSSTPLSDITPGGAWSSSNTSRATVVGGMVTGVAAGTATISYTLAGCNATAVVTVNPMPSAILGATNVCDGLTIPLSDAAIGGVWSSSNTVTAPVTVGGVVTGSAVGTATISYTLGAACTVTSAVTVNLSPAAITGPTAVCVGLTTSLSDITLGGTWTSSNTTVATVSGGVVTGVSGGTAIIAYTIGAGCAATSTVTVNISAPVITGTTVVCAGLTTNLSDASGGGTWTSSNTSIATVGAGSGIVSGVSPGTVTITYTLGIGCSATTAVTVNLSASPITGTTTVCAGATTPLSDVSGGGAWSSSNTSVAAIAGSGLVTGISAGTTTITYLIGIGCSASAVVTVKPSPSAITGAGSVCIGSATTLSDAGGGTWSSSNTAIATVGISSGIVTGVSAGPTVIIYTLAGCSATGTILVNPLPSAYTVTGGGSFCAGGTGVHIGLGSSDLGVNYELFDGLTLMTTLPGILSALDFGLETAAGTYTVVANNTSTGCTNTMLGSAVITITALATPSVSITAVPGDTICTGGHVTFTAVPVFGGTTPAYQWTDNSVNVGTASTYTPLTTPNNGDIIRLTMTSNYACLTTATAVSTPLVIHVEAPSLNLDTIKVTRSNIEIGQVDTFVVIAPHGGATPAYQWYLNGLPISGATNATYITDTLANGDKVLCRVTSSDECATPTTNFSNSIKISISTGVVNMSNAAGNFTLVPNPNKGEFTINGTLKSMADEQVSIVVTDMVGQTIYRETAQAHNGALNEHITLQSSIARGIYLVKVSSGDEPVVFRIVVE